MLNNNLISILIRGIREASEILMTHYRNPGLVVTEKEDLSPVTGADVASHDFLSKFLGQEFPGIPLLSEEGIKEKYSIRKTFEYSWILDPLDGTKEFIARNDEFAINLALLHKNKPVLGIISIPAKNLIYYASKGEGSWKISGAGPPQRLPVHASSHLTTRRITVLVSRSHSGQAETEYVKKIEDQGWQVDVRPTGSAYKHVLLAEGSAHVYVKPGICWEWDTAPGQIILEEAGGSVVRLDTGEPLVYNKEILSNPDLIMWAPGVIIPL